MNAEVEYVQRKAILELILKNRFSLEEEKVTQYELAETLLKQSAKFQREYKLDAHNTIDFYFPELKLGIELKIGNASRMAIYKQVEI